jgi:methyl-accepting chemotaxis protein
MAQLSRTVEGTFAQQGINIVKRAASLVDGDSFEKLARSLDENDPFYEETRVNLLKLKQSVDCLYLYTMAHLEGDTWMFIIDGSAEPDDNENFSSLGDEEDASDYDDAFTRTVNSLSTEASSLVHQDGWGWLISVYTPIINSKGKLVGIVGCDFDGTSLRNAIVKERSQTILIGLISVAVGLVLMQFFMRMIFPRLKYVNTFLNSLGEGDLTRLIKIDKKDEIGELSNHFNMTSEKIKDLIGTIKNKVNSLTNTSDELSSNMEKTSKAVDRITENFDHMKNLEDKQEDEARKASQAVEEIKAGIDSLKMMVEEQAGNVSSSSSAIEEMTANINSVTKTLVENNKNVDSLAEASENEF